MSKITYSPKSHFYVDHTNLVAPIPANIGSDAFGPVDGDKPNKFRTTSFIRSSSRSAVFAICDGHLLIEPQTGDATKVNLILKPSVSFAPLKIKYFIYRGVEKQGLINSLLKMNPVDGNDPTQPDFLRKIWTHYLNLNHPDHLEGGGDIENPPEEMPAILLGYDPSEPGTTLLDYMFFNNEDLNPNFQIPKCSKGEHIGNFSSTIGLDIVLDDGDYNLDYEEQLFKLDLEFARKADNVFDLSSIADADKHKKYKEYIHRFIDAAAFWGSHVDCGEVIIKGDPSVKKTATDIYTFLVNKYQTSNSIYLYIQSERGRSYNYYGTYPNGDLDFALNGSVASLNAYATDGWPIVIKTFPQATAAPLDKLQLSLGFNIDPSISDVDRTISLYGVIPDGKRDTFIIDSQLRSAATLTGQTNALTSLPLKNYVSAGASVSVASFLYFTFSGDQKLTFKNSYNDLWKATVKPNFTIAVTDEMALWASNMQTRLANFKPITGINNTVIQQKVVLDNGKDSGGNRKKRKLFIASISDTYIDANDDHSNVVVNGFKSGFEKVLTKNNYIISLFDKPNLDVYKGKILDGVDTVQTLSLISRTDFEISFGYFQLGITEEEYNKLLYNDPVAPAVLPAVPHLSVEASNITFYLEEDTTISVSKDYRKFKLGLLFENKKGEIQPVLYPATAANEVFVYTVDNQYFFSKEFSDFQEFYQEFAKAKVEFRTKIVTPDIPVAYNGEFGFDWLRIGDNGEPSYESTVESGFESHSTGDTANTEYESKPEAARSLKREYMRIATQKADEFYYTPYLNIFPNTWIKNPMPPSEAELRVLVEIDADHDKLEFDYDAAYFTIDKPILTDKTVTAKVESQDHTIKITCIKDFAEHKKIRVLAYEIGKPLKADAKLAGEINVLKNSLIFRKEEKFVLVKVITDIDNDGIPKTGSFTVAEKNNLRNALYQSMIYSILEDGPDLDLSNDIDYKITGPIGAKSYGKFIYNNLGLPDTNLDGGLYEDYPAKGMFIDLKNKFLHLPGNLKYLDYFFVFSFDDPPYDTAVGQIQEIGVRNLILLPARNERTICHEGLHGLGLYHTHRDGPITEKSIKHTFPNANLLPINKDRATDNYLSYNGVNRKSTWKWQWEIVKLIFK